MNMFASLRSNVLRRVSPIKSVRDERDYRLIVLENGLRALLISDATTEHSAACMEVGVGALTDPLELPGLAHFCEHMLFLGTEKYPNENAYKSFLASHGGRSNASTSPQTTNYYFEVTAPHFSQAVDIFAQFFVAPLFAADCTDRELNAVDAENAKNLNSDVRRINQVLKATSHPGYVFQKFSTGNLVTLRERPAQAGIDVRAALMNFHSRYYSASNMELCLLGTESLDALEELVATSFGAVKSNGFERAKTFVTPSLASDLRARSYGGAGFPYCDVEPMMLEIVPVKDLRQVRMIFPLPELPQRDYSTHCVGQYVSHLVGHEGPGSVLEFLKNKALATGLSASYSTGSVDYATLSVTVELTAEGLAHIEDVVATTFSYIRRLTSVPPQKWVFDELKVMSDLRFEFLEKRDALPHVEALSADMHYYPDAEVLRGPYLLDIFDASLVEEKVLKHLTPTNMRLVVISKNASTKSVEEWYGTPYELRPIPKQWLELWKSADLLDELVFPQPNTFLPSNTNIAASDSLGGDKTAPTKLVDTETMALWHEQDREFLIPKLSVRALLHSSACYSSPRASVLSKLTASMVREQLNPLAYAAECAGLSYDVSDLTKGWVLSVSGYSDKVPLLLEHVVKTCAGLSVDPRRFEDIKEKTLRAYRNVAMDTPQRHAGDRLWECLQAPMWTVTEELQAIEEVNAADVQEFARSVFPQTKLSMLVHGNASEATARQIGAKVTSGLGLGASVPASSSPSTTTTTTSTTATPNTTTGSNGSEGRSVSDSSVRLVALEPSSSYSTTRLHPNPDEVNSCVLFYLQVGLLDPSAEALQKVVRLALAEPAFYRLRTVEQLGYIVQTSTSDNRGVGGLRLVVVSKVAHPVVLEERIEAFLSDFESKLDEWASTKFETAIAAVIEEVSKKDKRLYQRTSRLWDEIFTENLVFDRAALQVEYLRSLSPDVFLQHLRSTFFANGEARRKFVVHVPSQRHQEKFGGTVPPPPASVQVIERENEFKARMGFWPKTY